jgi:hypothetical protein
MHFVEHCFLYWQQGASFLSASITAKWNWDLFQNRLSRLVMEARCITKQLAA